MTYTTNHEADEDTPAWEVCDKCHEPDPHLEDVETAEQLTERWCQPCLHTEAERMREEEDRDAEMRSLKGYFPSEIDRI